ncbi:MAG: MoaD/ThiS family protein [Gammaproteobacteria bacterium]
MKITFKMFASLTQYLPPEASGNIVEIDVDEQASVHDVIDAHRVPRQSAHLVLVNGVYILPEDRDKPILKAGDVLALWPPVAGG